MNLDIHPIITTPASSAPLLIAGPCSAESEEQMLATARGLCDAGIDIFRAGVWKPRTRPGGFEGHGRKALEWMGAVKRETGMTTATEIGCAAHAREALEAGIDILWIGARTTSSPFAMQEIADSLAGTDAAVLVKNPVCADLDLWIGAVERLYLAGIRRLGVIHRGFKVPGSTDYRNAPLWEIAEAFRREFPEIPMLCDPSHMGGMRERVAPLSAEAIARGYDGLIIESHIDPESALTDARQQVTPAMLSSILEGSLPEMAAALR